jgi:hypothetical protein
MTTDTTIKKIDSRHSPKGDMGQTYLASGVSLAMRLWHEEQSGQLTATLEPRPQQFDQLGQQ